MCSGNTQRRTALLLGVNHKTIVRKFLWLSELAKKEHLEWLNGSNNSTEYVQFDEMETFEHTKLKPLSIAMSVRPSDYMIVDARVASMPAKGWLSKLSLKKYGRRADDRKKACSSVISSIEKLATKEITVLSDKKPAYRGYFSVLKGLQLVQCRSRRYTKLLGVSEDSLDTEEEKEAKSRKDHDPMFALNHMCAKLRADISRLIRRTWSTTKLIDRLQNHLYLYIAYNNGYKII